MGTVAQLLHLKDATPAAPTGTDNVAWLQSAPYNTTAVVNGATVPVVAIDASANFPNVGLVNARTTTSETIGLSARGKLVTLSNASPVAVTLDSTVPASFLVW